MKTLFKLVVALLVLNASVRGALAMWQYYQFKDAAQQVVLFGQRAEPEEIQANIVARATELERAGETRRHQGQPGRHAHDCRGLVRPAGAVLPELPVSGEVHVPRGRGLARRAR